MAAPNFVNRTLWTGDNLDILRGLNSESIDLIYLDPPFNSNKNYEAPVGSKAAGAAFKDAWTLSDLDVAWMGLIADEQPAIAYMLDAAGKAHGKGMQSYLTMMAVRLMEMRRVLKPAGSIYLHCDPYASHYLKMLMDAVFDKANFQNEIAWCYEDVGGRATKYFKRKHDIILTYHKGKEWVFNVQRKGLSASTVKRYSKYFDANGQITYRSLEQSNPGVFRKLKGIPDDLDRIWLDVNQGAPLNDWWTDMSAIKNGFAESIGYPTQKPLALLERIIQASSNPGDVVLDPFCGCATACVAAERLGRAWLGIDLSPKATELVNVRLQGSMGSLFHNRLVTARTDIPKRTDIDAPINYRKNKHVLFGQQEGRCAGCRMDFPFKIFEVDHLIPQARGGTDHLGNLQLLCPHCNRIKGDRPQEYLLSQLSLVAAF